MRVNKGLYLILICVSIYACKSDGNKSINHDSDISYKLFQLENLGWKSKTISHFVKDIQYKATEVPIEYFLLKDQGSQDLLMIDSLSKKHTNERIIEFEFAHNADDDLLQTKYTSLNYDKSVTYLASTIKNDFIAVTSKNDTILCAGVQFERTYKIGPYKRILLYFGGVDHDETIQLIYQDRLFKNGIFKFKFNEIPFKS